MYLLKYIHFIIINIFDIFYKGIDYFTKNIDLVELLIKDKLIISKISVNKMKNIFNYSKHFKYINYIFRRVFK